MARLTRKELKKDPFLSVYYDDFVEFAQKNYQTMILVAVAIAVVILAGIWLKRYRQKQALDANALLGEALTTYRAPVGQADQGSAAPGTPSFTDASAKYEAALKQFRAVYEKYPREEAAQIALYHVGLCEAALGREDAAVKVLEQATHVSDKSVAALARFALAGELAHSGKLARAESMLTDLAEHPTDTVPAPTAWLALADIERASNPSEARAIYQRVIKDYGSDSDLVETAKNQMASLPEH